MGQQVSAQFQAERDALASILRDAAKAGVSPQEAASRALDAAKAFGADWQALFQAALATVSQEAAGRLLREWQRDGLLPDGVTYDPTRDGSKVAEALASGATGRQADATAQTTVDTLRAAFDRQLSQGIDANGIDDLITALEDAYAAWLDGRVDTIADVQVVGGWSLGEMDAAFTAGNVTGSQAVRTWVTVGDAKVRPEHAAADGQQVGLNEPFDVGGEPLMYPGSPEGSAGNVINCRCGLDWSLQLSTGNDG